MSEMTKQTIARIDMVNSFFSYGLMFALRFAA